VVFRQRVKSAPHSALLCVAQARLSTAYRNETTRTMRTTAATAVSGLVVRHQHPHAPGWRGHEYVTAGSGVASDFSQQGMTIGDRGGSACGRPRDLMEGRDRP
jgi:hypothetical protein